MAQVMGLLVRAQIVYYYSLSNKIYDDFLILIITVFHKLFDILKANPVDPSGRRVYIIIFHI
jgi:hypothetical protein